MAGRAFTPPETLSPENIHTIADVRRAVWINGLFGMGAGSVTGAMGHIVLQKLQRHFVGDSISSTSTPPPRTASQTDPKKIGIMYRCLRPLPPLGKNTFLLSLLGGGALGSFVMSTTAGKNAVHLLHPIFQVGKDENVGKSPYQIAVLKDKEQQRSQFDESDTIQKISEETSPNLLTNIGSTSAGNSQTNEDDDLDAAHHRIRSVRRSASIKHRLETGQSLTNTHGNTWPESSEQTEEVQKDRSMHRAQAWERRQTVRKEWVQDRIAKGRALSDSTGGHWAADKEEEEGKE